MNTHIKKKHAPVDPPPADNPAAEIDNPQECSESEELSDNDAQPLDDQPARNLNANSVNFLDRAAEFNELIVPEVCQTHQAPFVSHAPTDLIVCIEHGQLLHHSRLAPHCKKFHPQLADNAVKSLQAHFSQTIVDDETREEYLSALKETGTIPLVEVS